MRIQKKIVKGTRAYYETGKINKILKILLTNTWPPVDVYKYAGHLITARGGGGLASHDNDHEMTIFQQLLYLPINHRGRAS